jgi:hypothetical protein
MVAVVAANYARLESVLISHPTSRVMNETFSLLDSKVLTQWLQSGSELCIHSFHFALTRRRKGETFPRTQQANVPNACGRRARSESLISPADTHRLKPKRREKSNRAPERCSKSCGGAKAGEIIIIMS